MTDHVRTGSGVFLSGTSMGSLFASIITQSNITWMVGILSGLSALAMLYLSYRKHMREEISLRDNKKVLEAQVEYYKKKTELLTSQEE